MAFRRKPPTYQYARADISLTYSNEVQRRLGRLRGDLELFGDMADLVAAGNTEVAFQGANARFGNASASREVVERLDDADNRLHYLFDLIVTTYTTYHDECFQAALDHFARVHKLGRELGVVFDTPRPLRRVEGECFRRSLATHMSDEVQAACLDRIREHLDDDPFLEGFIEGFEQGA